MFLKEVPGWISVAGAVLIVLSGMALQFSNLAEQEDKARKSGT
jgi:hypothetical protein